MQNAFDRALGVFACCLLSAVFACSPATLAAAEPSSNEEILLRALNHRVTIEFDDMPAKNLLEELVEMLPEEKRVSLVFDRRSLQESGVDLETKVTLKATNVRLRSALSFVLRQIHAGWTLQDELLLVTSDDVAGYQMLVRAYDVEHLVAPEGAAGSPPNFRPLIEVIQKEIAPNTWTNNDGPGSIEPFALNGYRLVIRQTPANHFEIARLLSELRETPPLPVDEPLPAVAKTSEQEMPAEEPEKPTATDGAPAN